MIPILYDTNETAFTSNGLGRLRDCIECTVSEERNGIYEASFSYPLTGANFDQIRVGRIIGVTHDDTGDIQPFDIVSYERPIDGIVTFHCTHISYRQSYLTVTGSNINSLADAFTLLGTATPDNPFSYETDITASAYMSAADGTPRSVRQMLGGIEGSILDTYGGEYEWNDFRVILHQSRGRLRPFSIRYGVNMLNYNEDYDISGSYSSCVPYWTDGSTTIVGDRQDAPNPTVTNRGECVPLDVSDKFESQPTKAQVEAMGLSLMSSKRTFNPTQTISVEFARLQELGEYDNYSALYNCRLCDTINVVFPDYNANGTFKIVKTVWNVLADRFDEMQLGDLSISLSQALGVSSGSSYSGSGGGESGVAYITETGTSGIWTYRKWSDGTAECWGTHSWTISSWTGWGSTYYSTYSGNISYPSGLFNATPTVTADGHASTEDCWLAGRSGGSSTQTPSYFLMRSSSGTNNITGYLYIHAIGKWQ